MKKKHVRVKEADLRSYTRLHDEALPPLGFLTGALGSDTDSHDCAYIHPSCLRNDVEGLGCREPGLLRS